MGRNNKKTTFNEAAAGYYEPNHSFDLLAKSHVKSQTSRWCLKAPVQLLQLSTLLVLSPHAHEINNH